MDIQSRIKRYRSLYEDHRPGAVVIFEQIAGTGEQEPVDLAGYDLSDLKVHRALWEQSYLSSVEEMDARSDVDDDWIPALGFGYGFGYFGAVFCDAALTFRHNTSYIDSMGVLPEEITEEILDKDRFWRQVILEQTSFFAGLGGGIHVDPFPNPSPLDMVNMFRGNEVFTDFYDWPDETISLLDRCADASIRFNRQIAERRREVFVPGSVAFHRWYPSGVCVLEDAADLCSPELYLTFGRPFTQKVLHAFGGGYIHHHSLGIQQFGNIGSLEGLWVEQISSDPSCRRPVSYLEELLERRIPCVLDLEVTPEEICDNMRLLKRGRFILDLPDRVSKQEARELCALVRAEL